MLLPLIACTADPDKCESCGADDSATHSTTGDSTDSSPDTDNSPDDSDRHTDSDTGATTTWDCDEVADGCSEAVANITIETDRVVDAFAARLTYTGDLDGDSRDDLLISDYGYIDTLTPHTSTIVLAGSLTAGTNSDASVTWARDAPFLPAGDVDSDARADLLYGCPLDGLHAVQLITDVSGSWEDREPCSSETARVAEQPAEASVDMSWGVGDVDGDGTSEFGFEEVDGVHHLVSLGVFSVEGGLLDDSIQITVTDATAQPIEDLDGDGLADATFTEIGGCCTWFYSGASLSHGTSYFEADADRVYSVESEGGTVVRLRPSPDLDGDGLGEEALLSQVGWEVESYRLRFVSPSHAETLDDASGVVESNTDHRIVEFWFPGDMNADGFEDVAVTAEDADDVLGFRVWAGGAFSGTYDIDEGAFFYVWGSTYGQSPGFGAPYGQGDINGDGALDLLFGNSNAGAAHVLFGPLTE